jgi:hypothetical protein
LQSEGSAPRNRLACVHMGAANAAPGCGAARIAWLVAGKTEGMSSEERQRTIREHGSRPAEAEKAEAARAGREAVGRLESERQTDQEDAQGAAPVAEDDASKPRPRR